MKESKMTTIDIAVDGMTCGGCVKSIERALIGQRGVSAAQASLEKKQVSISFDSEIVTPAHLEQAIQKAGFSVPAQR
jgi:copper chaperone